MARYPQMSDLRGNKRVDQEFVQLVLSIVNPNGLFVDVHSGKVAELSA